MHFLRLFVHEICSMAISAKRYLKSKTFARAFLAFMLLFTVLLSVFWGALFGLFYNSERQKITVYNNESSNKMKIFIDEALGVPASVTRYLKNARWVNKLADETQVFAAEFDYSRKSELEQQLLSFSAAHSPIRHIAVLYAQQDFAVTSQGWFSMEDYKNYSKRKFFLNQDIFAKLSSAKTDVTVFDYQNDEYVVALQNLIKTNNLNVISMCLLSKEGIRHSLSNSFPLELSRLRIYDDIEKTDLTFNLSDEPSGQKIILHSELVGLSYEFTYQDDIDSSTYAASLAIAFLPCFLFGIVVSYLLACHNYHPVLKLVSRFIPKDDSENKVIHQEYEFLEHTFDTIINENNTLQEKIESYGATVRFSLIQQLLQGYFDLKDIEARLKQFQIPFYEEKWYTVISLRYSEGEVNSAFELLPILQEYFSGEQKYLLCESCEAVETYDNSIAVIFCNEARISSEALIEQAGDELRQLLKINFHITCGAPYWGILGISKSYQEAKLLREEKMIEYYYPNDWEKQLIMRLTEGNLEQVQNILREVHTENKLRHIDLSGKGILLKAVFNTICAAAAKVGCPLLTPELATKISHERKLDAAFDYIQDSAIIVCKYVCENNVKQSESLRQSLVVYVNKNYCNPELSLKDLGEKFNLSVTMVSKLFKEAAGKNFHDYITKMRMEKAKGLLSTIHYNVSLVSKAVGYESEYSFKRAFQNTVGVKARQYAEENGPHNDK